MWRVQNLVVGTLRAEFGEEEPGDALISRGYPDEVELHNEGVCQLYSGKEKRRDAGRVEA